MDEYAPKYTDATQPVVPVANPPLWNPNAAACWSLLFSPAFGAYLHARNAEVLGRTAEAKTNWQWFYGVLAYLAFMLVAAVIPVLNHLPTGFIGLAVLLAWYFTLGKKQFDFVKATYGETYQRKTWGTPLLMALAPMPSGN